jgi:spore germination protein KC
VQGSQENTQGAKPEASLVYNGLAVLRRDKLVGWMNDKESKGYSYLSSEVKNTVGSVPCPDGNGSFVIEVFNSNAKVKAKVKDGKPKIHVKLYNEMNIAEVRCKIDLTSVDTIKKLEKLTEHSNKDIAMTSIKKAKKLKSDVFGFGEAIHRAAPKTWKKLRKNWDTKGFVEVPVEIESEVKIRRTGTMSKSYLKDLNPKE